MTRLICSVLLVFLLGSALFSESDQDLLSSMKRELDYLQNTLISIINESNQMQMLQQKLLNKNEQLLKWSEQEQNILQHRIDYLEMEYERVQESRTELEKDYELLNASEGTWTALKSNYEEGEKILEGQIRLWRGVAIGTAVAAVAVVVYLIVK